MNRNQTFLLVGFALMLAAALPLRAQTGCVDSPEDPTIILALVGGAGALGAYLRSVRLGKRRPTRSKDLGRTAAR
jgi:XrtJ-associated TM-motif-TM protein